MISRKTSMALPLLVAGFLAATGSIAWSHNQVVATTPAANETVSESPLFVSVQTAENLLDLGGNQAGFAIVVTDEAGLFYGDGCVELNDRTLSTMVNLGEAGAYEVTYQFVSEDGHTISDRFSFTFDPGAGHTPAAGYPEAPICGEEPPSATEPTEPAEIESTPEVAVEPISAPMEPSGPGAGSVIAGVLGALAALGAIIALALRRRG